MDAQLEFMLSSSGAVLIEGPKWCGKSTTARMRAASVIEMDEPGNMENLANLARVAPALILEGATPRLIDEWQAAPVLWDAVRHEVDRRGVMAQFILTGSSTPMDKSAIFHSGTGRITKLKMRTMSLYESEDSDGFVSLTAMFGGEAPKSHVVPMNIHRLAYLICRGGWPMSLDLEPRASLQQAKNYLKAVVESDMSAADGVRKDPVKTYSLIRSLARNVSTRTPLSTLLDDLQAGDGSMSAPTATSYLNALKAIHLLDDLDAWNPNLRSKAAIRTSPTRHFVDPSIAVAALGIAPEELVRDLKTMGLVFESLAIRDLRVYADAIGGQVFHYRDSSDLECDAIVRLDNGSWGAFEIKLSEHFVEDGARTLRSLAERVDTERMGNPSFLAVLTGDAYSYVRDDGIFVVGIGSLKP
ncbi:MAG: DUF4143 domain-containing protein [Candidatus Izemoplasmatales bacterium]